VACTDVRSALLETPVPAAAEAEPDPSQPAGAGLDPTLPAAVLRKGPVPGLQTSPQLQ